MFSQTKATNNNRKVVNLSVLPPTALLSALKASNTAMIAFLPTHTDSIINSTSLSESVSASQTEVLLSALLYVIHENLPHPPSPPDVFVLNLQTETSSADWIPPLLCECWWLFSLLSHLWCQICHTGRHHPTHANDEGQ